MLTKPIEIRTRGQRGGGGEGMFPNLAAALVDSGPESVNRLNVPNAEKQM